MRWTWSFQFGWVMDDSSTDRLYRDPRAAATPFRFDARVAAVFDDMINRSVPGYGEVQALTAASLVARGEALPPGQPLRVTDLGCSTGRTLLDLAHVRRAHGATFPVHYVGLDASIDMLRRAEQHWCGQREELRNGVEVRWQHADVRHAPPPAAEVMLCQYTLQFLPMADRPALLRRWVDQLMPGGLFLLSEKVRLATEEDQARETAAHLAFKREQGYSDLEIAGKRQALENVLETAELEENVAWLRAAGLDPVRLEGRWQVFACWSGVRRGQEL